MKLAIKTYANPFFSEVDIIYVFPFVIVFTAIQIKSLVDWADILGTFTHTKESPAVFHVSIS